VLAGLPLALLCGQILGTSCRTAELCTIYYLFPFPARKGSQHRLTKIASVSLAFTMHRQEGRRGLELSQEGCPRRNHFWLHQIEGLQLSPDAVSVAWAPTSCLLLAVVSARGKPSCKLLKGPGLCHISQWICDAKSISGFRCCIHVVFSL